MSDSPYAHAREVAMRIVEKPGSTARELYRLFGDRFHEWNYDGHKAATIIAQHLAKLEEEGLVISEKKGKERSAPKAWTWVGPKPAIISDANQQDTKPMDINIRQDEPRLVTPADDLIPQPPTILEPHTALDAALIAVRDAALAMARQPIDRREEKVACLQRLADITAPDIASLLNEIAEDLA